MRTIPGFHAVRCVAPAPDGTLFVVGRHAKVGGTALWEVEPGGRVVRCGPASATYSHWIDVIGSDREQYGVSVRPRAFDFKQPRASMPTVFDRRPDGSWTYFNDFTRFWAGGRIFVDRSLEGRTGLLVASAGGKRAATEYQLPSPAEYATDEGGVTVAARYREVPRPAVRDGYGHVTPSETRTEWRLFRLNRGEPLGPPRVVSFDPEGTVIPVTGGLLVKELTWNGSAERVGLVTAGLEVTELDVAGREWDVLLDAAPGMPTLALRRAARSLVVDGRAFKFTGDRNVLGARLAPDGLTAYAWTRTELIQFDL